MGKKLNTGVYCFQHRASGKVYVGSTVASFNDRRMGHVALLRANKHHSIHFQRAWNKHGEDAFEFIILERCAPHRCIKREQYWINRFDAADCEHGYNRCPVAGSPLGVKRTKAQRQHQSEIRKGKKRPPEAVAKGAATHTGMKRPPGTGAKISKAKKGKKFTEKHKSALKRAWERRLKEYGPSGRKDGPRGPREPRKPVVSRYNNYDWPKDWNWPPKS